MVLKFILSLQRKRHQLWYNTQNVSLSETSP